MVIKGFWLKVEVVSSGPPHFQLDVPSHVLCIFCRVEAVLVSARASPLRRAFVDVRADIFEILARVPDLHRTKNGLTRELTPSLTEHFTFEPGIRLMESTDAPHSARVTMCQVDLPRRPRTLCQFSNMRPSLSAAARRKHDFGVHEVNRNTA